MSKTKLTVLHAGYMRSAVRKKCPVCSIKFITPADPKKSAVYCSRSCWLKHRTKLATTIIQCHVCGKKCHRSKSKLSGSKSGLYFCSRGCKDSAQEIDGALGVNMARYTSGIWGYRKKAFKYRGKKCGRCGYDHCEEMLDAHHIDGNRANNVAKNLLVLCVWCHLMGTRKVKPHSWNGKL
jgi:hypothetical protein